MVAATASQTIGPYWHMIEDKDWSDLTRFGVEGARIRLVGTIVDGAGALVPDACVEVWQTSPAASACWQGFGRAATDRTGSYAFTTVKPGPTAMGGGRNAQQAPHVALTIFARGLMSAVHTRLYFEGEPGNADDPLLASLEPSRRRTLLARREGEATWRLDIRLQGGEETVFLDV